MKYISEERAATLLPVPAILRPHEGCSCNRKSVIGESRWTVGNLFSTNWPIVQISHWIAVAEWRGETRAAALMGNRRDCIRV